ncbi:hypothetical protein [Mesonia sp. HuA40]|nr:hypothetical protein [Mesonia sp. HuA40]
MQGNFELQLTPGQHVLKVQAIGFKNPRDCCRYQ